MNKDGFIATALIYSFFLVFCAVLLIYTTTSIHNKNLLNRSLDEARENTGFQDLKVLKIGDYAKLNVTYAQYNFNAINWIVYKITDDKVYFVSDEPLISINNEGNINNTANTIITRITNFTNTCTVDKFQIMTVSEYNAIKNIDLENNISDGFLIDNEGNYKKCIYDSEEETYKYIDYTDTEKVVSRAIAVIDFDNIIKSGSGNINQPYTFVGC